jgi:heme-degrading monooxygenase HmoA
VVRSVLYVRPRSGKANAVVEFYKRKRVLETALEQPGCIATEIQVPLNAEEPLLVTALWQSAEAYQGWIENPVRRTFATGLDELVDEDLANVRGGVYEVAHAVGAQSERS